jgi:hypothetical protein
MFRASSAHPQEVNVVNCTCMQPLVFSFSAGGRLVHLLRGAVYQVGTDKGIYTTMHGLTNLKICTQTCSVSVGSQR